MPGAAIVCPGCGHPAREHALDFGCVHGWPDWDGSADDLTQRQCHCRWAHVHISPEHH